MLSELPSEKCCLKFGTNTEHLGVRNLIRKNVLCVVEELPLALFEDLSLSFNLVLTVPVSSEEHFLTYKLERSGPQNDEMNTSFPACGMIISKHNENQQNKTTVNCSL